MMDAVGGGPFGTNGGATSSMHPANITNKVKVSTVRVYFRGQNLWTWTRDKDLYVDPEQSISGYVNSVQPLIKTFSLGLDIGF